MLVKKQWSNPQTPTWHTKSPDDPIAEFAYDAFAQDDLARYTQRERAVRLEEV